MQYKDMKQGYPVYFFDKEAVKAYAGKVVSVAVPRYDAPKFGAPAQPSTGMVVDVTIEAEGATRTYTIPEASAVTYAGALVLSTDRDGILREVESLKASATEALAKVDHYREALAKCDTILEELNPALAERREQDRRIGGIEAEVKSLGAKWSPEEVKTGRAGQESGECVMPPMQTSARCSLLS